LPRQVVEGDVTVGGSQRGMLLCRRHRASSDRLITGCKVDNVERRG
jgi:hypothetical protein